MLSHWEPLAASAADCKLASESVPLSVGALLVHDLAATVCMAIIHLALVHNLLAVIMSMRRQEESGEKVRNQENRWECGSGIRRKSEESDEHVARRLPHIAVLADMQPFPQRRQSTVTLPVRPRSRNRERSRSALEYFRSWKDLRRPCQRYDTEVEGKQ